MTDGTLKGALKAVLPHAGGAAARKGDTSWLFVGPGRVLATDRFTMAVCRFTDHEVAHLVRLDGSIVPLLTKVLSMRDATVSAAEDSLTVLADGVRVSAPALEERNNERVVSSVDRLLAQWRNADVVDEQATYQARYLSRLSDNSLGKGARVTLRMHGGTKPTTFTVGEYFEGAIQPVWLR